MNKVLVGPLATKKNGLAKPFGLCKSTPSVDEFVMPRTLLVIGRLEDRGLGRDKTAGRMRPA